MPKIKTSKTVSKRILNVTKQGKLVRLRMAAQHLAQRKSKRARKHALTPLIITSSLQKRIKRLIPYR